MSAEAPTGQQCCVKVVDFDFESTEKSAPMFPSPTVDGFIPDILNIRLLCLKQWQKKIGSQKNSKYSKIFEKIQKNSWTKDTRWQMVSTCHTYVTASCSQFYKKWWSENDGKEDQGNTWQGRQENQWEMLSHSTSRRKPHEKWSRNDNAGHNGRSDKSRQENDGK